MSNTEHNINLPFLCGSFNSHLLCVPFCSWLPMWLRKANSLSAQRDNFPRPLRSDLYFSKTMFNGQGNYEENTLVVETGQQVPPLYISLILCFIATWTPYIVMSFVFLIMGFGFVNVLWFECINSLLMGVVFWLKSDHLGQMCQTQGPQARCSPPHHFMSPATLIVV